MTSVPTVSDGDADDPVWYPLQHALGIDTFGVNLFIASRADQTLVEEHDERASGQQELYVLIEGEAVFDLDDEHVHLNRAQPSRSPTPLFDAARKPRPRDWASVPENEP
jgi:hypothetical protein